MGDSISSIVIGATTLNVYDIVAFLVKDKTLVVYTVGETLYFNEPADVSSVSSVHTDLTGIFSSLGTSNGGSGNTGGTGGSGNSGNTGGTTNPPTTTTPTTPGNGSTGSTGGDSGSGGSGSGDSGSGETPPDGSGHQTPNPNFDTTGMTYDSVNKVWHDPKTDNYYWPDGTLADAGSGTDDDEEDGSD